MVFDSGNSYAGFLSGSFGIRKKITGNSFQNTEVQNIIGGEGTNIQALKAGRDINISINPGLKEKAKLSIADIPFIFAEPAEFIIYKPLDSKTPGQEKLWIKIKLTNQSAYYANNVHINFLTEDGTGHKTNSDLWNEEMGTKSLYTFNSICPSDKKYAAWRPDVPPNYEQLLKSGKAMFKLVIYVKWKDMQNKEYDFLSLSELRYNKELDTFVFEVKENYNSLNDRAKIDFVLDEFEKIEKM